jgi:outer membrane murein-binding lipoprotein Lpp
MSLDGSAKHHHFASARTTSPQLIRAMRSTTLLALATTVVVVAACTNPRTESNVAQALNDAAIEISGLKNDIAQLSTEIDSLRQALVKQDSMIARIAAVNNIPIPR